jgi:AbrB family looped-hinge helix DNA binding protein
MNARGQVTIPRQIRECAGLAPGTDVEFICEGGVVHVWKSGQPKPDAVAQRIAAFTGTGNSRRTTEELMALLRGHD